MTRYQNVLITGAAGGVGRVLRQALKGRYPNLRLSDVQPLEDVESSEDVVIADLSNLEAVHQLMRDVDAVVHMGGISAEDEWDALLPANIVGTYNLYEAARRAGVKRVVFASSNHVVGFHRRTRVIGPDEAIRPDTRYGVTKAFGEALARLYADKHGLESVCLRIGQFRPRPANSRMLSLWLSPEDMVRLVQSSLDADNVHFEVVYGVSANQRGWYENPGAVRIGYVPQENAEDYLTAVQAQPDAEDEVGRLFQGGPFCSTEFDGAIDDIG